MSASTQLGFDISNRIQEARTDLIFQAWAADFKAVWDQFKATRENEIILAIYKGNADDAKKIASGIQSERLSKMWSIMSCKAR